MDEDVGSGEVFLVRVSPCRHALWGPSAAGWWYVLCLEFVHWFTHAVWAQQALVAWVRVKHQWGFGTVAWDHPPTDNRQKTDECKNAWRSWTCQEDVNKSETGVQLMRMLTIGAAGPG